MAAIMLDIETLSTRPDAIVLTLGAVKFDPFSDEIDIENGLYMKLDVDAQSAVNRHVQEDTLKWWSQQDTVVFEDAMSEGDRLSIDEFTARLNKFVVGAKDLWSQGSFDFVILENLYHQFGKPVPWQFWQLRDSRTLFGVCGDPREKGRKDAHNSLMDSYYQAIGVQQVYENLKEYIQPKK